MMNESFLFYKSFLDGIDRLSDEEQLKAYRAISHYAVYGEEPEDDGGVGYLIFVMAKPQIDANNKRRASGKSGGEAKRDNQRSKQDSTATQDDVALPQNDSSTATKSDVALLHEDSSTATPENVAQLDNVNVNENVNVNDNQNLNENVKGKSKEKTKKEKESDALAERSFSEPVKEALSDWLQYKREKGQSYKPTGLKQLFDGIETEINNRGEPAVIEGIENSMRNNYQGIYYPRPQPKKAEVFDADAYLRERMMTG